MSLNAGRTLEGVASLGFNSLESAGYSNGMFYGMKPAAFSALCQSVGVEHISAHLGLNENNLEQLLTIVQRQDLSMLSSVFNGVHGCSDLEGFKESWTIYE